MTLRAFAQLVRLPNLPSALADICLGALAMQGIPPRWLPFLLLLLASACLYCGGMAWNDFFDVEQDRRERPSRPIPSGRVKRREAAYLGGGLLLAGLVLAAVVGWAGGPGWRFAPLVVAFLLGLAILLYDGWLKRTWAGPLGMGACRFLNVLLGLLVVDNPDRPWRLRLALALVVGLYIVGVTAFARTEARQSSHVALRGAALVMLVSLALAVILPGLVPPGS